MKLSMHFFHFGMLAIIKINPNYSTTISMILGEFINIWLIYNAFVAQQEYQLLLAVLDTTIVFCYQSTVFYRIRLFVIFFVKQVVFWLLAFIYFSNDDIELLLIPSFTTTMLLFGYGYFNYLQELKISKNKLEAFLMNEKIALIVNSIPDSIVIINEKLVSLYSNPSFCELVKENTFLQYFAQSKYHKRLYSQTQSTEILFDIKDWYFQSQENEANFGILENSHEFIELRGKKIL